MSAEGSMVDLASQGNGRNGLDQGNTTVGKTTAWCSFFVQRSGLHQGQHIQSHHMGTQIKATDTHAHNIRHRKPLRHGNQLFGRTTGRRERELFDSGGDAGDTFRLDACAHSAIW